MRKNLTAVLAGLLALGVVAGPAVADEEHDPELPRHSHMLIQRPEVAYLTDGPDGEGLYLVGWRRCIDLPVVPLQAHHRTIHTGNAGIQLLDRAGHVVIPSAGLAPWEDCADFETWLPLRVE
jgi:hypothetical protein